MRVKENFALSDAALAKDILRKLDALERLNDNVAETPLRRAVNERIVECRLLVRDGHLRNMNGGKGPSR